MTTNATPEELDAARAYNDLHVPAMFRQWPPRLIAAAHIGPGERVLDVACGTGVLARACLDAVGPEGRVAGLDLSPGMLGVARELEPAIEWTPGDAGALPFPEAHFDAVVSQFGLMFFPDRVLALREMLRVLRPGGRLAVAVWESLERSVAYPEAVALLQRLAGDQAADALRAPFVLGDPRALRALFEDAGVQAVEVATHVGTAHFPSIRVMVEADLRGWLPVMGVQLPEALIARILEEAEEALAPYRSAEGAAVFDAPAHVVAGRRA